jgi:membrane protein implicated in regulation of membrane protease activity
MYTAAIIWCVLMVAFLVVEGVCPVHLVSVWFAAGALVAAVVSLLSGPLWLQITAFLVVSATLLLSLWPLTKKLLNPNLVKTNVDAVIDTQGYVTADIDNLSGVGQVKLGAMEWTARSTSGAPIAVGKLVKVDRIEGVKAFVSEVEVPVQVH